MIGKYKLNGGTGFPLVFNLKETSMDKTPDSNLFKHVQLPPQTSKDIVTFGAKYVESRHNLNRAYFANEELAKAYHTIPYKALDLEHELLEIVGHIYSSIYIERDTGKPLDPDVLISMEPKELDKLTIDVVIGGVLYADRFPKLEGPVSEKAYKISMETYFDTFDILLENGSRFSIEEAEALGLGLFVDQLMGEFETEAEFTRAHSLNVKGFDSEDKEKEQVMKVYKYLKGILFSGAGLVLNPACPSCQILVTDRDEGCEECNDHTSQASSDVAEFSIDLTKCDSFMKEKIDNKEIKSNIYQVNIDTAVSGDDLSTPEVGPFSLTKDLENKNFSLCPSYRPEHTTEAGNTERFWCDYAEEKCEAAANRMDKECFRWSRKGEYWVFDTRNKLDPTYSPKDSDTEPVNTRVAASKPKPNNEAITKEALKNLIDGFSLFLESKAYEFDLKNLLGSEND